VSVSRLIEIMAALRDPASGCPWDLEQDFRTVAPYTLEEAYEVADAIERGDLTGLEEELGDLLLQVVFHARMASEQGAFDFDDVVRGICDKLVRRHPHVFGGETVDSAAAQTVVWEQHKARERAARGGSSGLLDDVPMALPKAGVFAHAQAEVVSHNVAAESSKPPEDGSEAVAASSVWEDIMADSILQPDANSESS